MKVLPRGANLSKECVTPFFYFTLSLFWLCAGKVHCVVEWTIRRGEGGGGVGGEQLGGGCRAGRRKLQSRPQASKLKDFEQNKLPLLSYCCTHDSSVVDKIVFTKDYNYQIQVSHSSLSSRGGSRSWAE